jgi:hypothetical protein
MCQILGCIPSHCFQLLAYNSTAVFYHMCWPKVVGVGADRDLSTHMVLMNAGNQVFAH